MSAKMEHLKRDLSKVEEESCKAAVHLASLAKWVDPRVALLNSDEASMGRAPH